MSYVRFDEKWQYNGCRVLRLESDVLRLDVLPELGGKILHLVHKPEDRDYLWQHPTLRPAILPNASNYDDNFCGGWDELFPSVGPGTHAGEIYPDHGEYWTRTFEWEVDRSGDCLTLYLRAEGGVTPTRMERWITLTAGCPAVRLRHRITHRGGHAFDFLWSQHPALAVGPTHEFIIPASSGVIGSPGLGRLKAEAACFTWPKVPGRDGKFIDFSKVPPSTKAPGYEMLYLTELKAGWYAVIDRATRSGIGFAFDRKIFNTLWLFQSHGGWRGLHLAIIEPCTGWPYDLAQAAAHGHCGRLEPGQTIDTFTALAVFTGRDGVAAVDLQGNVE
jgi:hypothetical protein